MSKKPKHSTEDIMLSAFVGVESAHAFSAFEPSIFTIQTLAVPQGDQDRIRLGYIPSVLFSAVLGGIVSKIRHNWLPLAFGMGTCGFMLTVYEMAIRTAPAPPATKLSPEAGRAPPVRTPLRFRIVTPRRHKQ